MKFIDLRSDTITYPTPEMRRAMYKAEVGDDVYGEDLTVNRLESLAAEKLGKQAALFTVSGTMGNLTAILTHTHHGEEIILGKEAHIFWYEVGGASALGGVMLHTVPNDEQGRLNMQEVEQAIRSKNIHYPVTTLLCLENTHNRCGGTVLTAEYTTAICRLAHHQGIQVHLDGARIFNAAVALDTPATTLVKDVDSVSFCLSKGLSAPVGSVLCGSQEFIERARKFRKMLGGGMRQAGIIAAAGIVAIETMIDRLAEDHANAKRLATGLSHVKGIEISEEFIKTNIVMFKLSPELSVSQFNDKLLEKGVKVGARGGNVFRAVTHRMIATQDIDEVLKRIETTCRELQHQD